MYIKDKIITSVYKQLYLIQKDYSDFLSQQALIIYTSNISNQLQFYPDQYYQFYLIYEQSSDFVVYHFEQMKNNTTQLTTMQRILDTVQPFWIGGLSGMIATSVIQPLDMIKVVIQLKSESFNGTKSIKPRVGFLSIARQIYSQSGVKSFYRGIDSALMRQVFYATTRLGVYRTLTEKITRQNKQKGKNNLSFYQKATCAITAGFCGSLIANPADLALVRMQADSQLPINQRRNYKNVIDAFKRIVKQEGITGLWRGATTTVTRAVVMSLAMLTSYDIAKQQILEALQKKDETLGIRVTASLVAGFMSSFSALPLDNAKTKLQKMKRFQDGTFPYKNIFDAISKTISRQGFTRLWVGYPTFYIRIAPHTCITLTVQDFITDRVKKLRKQH